MTFGQHRPRRARTALAGLFALSLVALTGCGDDTAGAETGTDVEDIAEETELITYDSAFYNDLESYEGQEVTVSADVNEVISPMAFTIAGTDDTDVEPMLVVSAEENNDLESDLTVAVSGTVHKAFDLPAVEDALGVDLDDELYDDWDAEPYIEATTIDTSVASDQ